MRFQRGCKRCFRQVSVILLTKKQLSGRIAIFKLKGGQNMITTGFLIGIGLVLAAGAIIAGAFVLYILWIILSVMLYSIFGWEL